MKLILEIGGNHLGSEEAAIDLAHSAIKAGGQYIKYQLYQPDQLVNKNVDFARFKHFGKFQLKFEVFQEIARICEKNQRIISASAWDFESLAKVDPYVSFHKIGSGDFTNLPLLRETFSTGKPIILSSGLCDESEVIKIIDMLLNEFPHYDNKSMLCLMQCTSVYPCPDNELNLSVITRFKELFNNIEIGYSDHSVGNSAIEVATILGATWIEKHFASDRTISDFRDLKCSIIPSEVKTLEKEVSRLNLLLGVGEKKKTATEISSDHINSFRRSIYLREDKKKGDTIQSADIITLRPMEGICASKVDEVIGKKCLRDIERMSSFNLCDIS